MHHNYTRICNVRFHLTCFPSLLPHMTPCRKSLSYKHIIALSPLNLFKERSTVFFHCRFPFLLFTGPYTIILGSSAKVEDVIQYADFSNRISPVRLADKSTVDLEPDVEELKGLMDGSLKLNNSDLHVLTSGKISISSNSESLGLVFRFVLASRFVCASFKIFIDKLNLVGNAMLEFRSILRLTLAFNDYSDSMVFP